MIGAAVAVSGILSAAQAQQANKAAAQNAKLANSAARTNLARLSLSQASKQSELGRRQAKILGQASTISAARNIGSGGSAADIARSIQISSILSNDAINLETRASQIDTLATLEQRLESLKAQEQNPLLQGIAGGLSGLMLGLSLDTQIQQNQAMGRLNNGPQYSAIHGPQTLNGV